MINVELFMYSYCALLKSVKKCLTHFLKSAITFRLFIVQIPFKYSQKGTKKLNSEISKQKCKTFKQK